MARYTTTVRSRRDPSEAFAYLADFSNARFWDPSVSQATRGEGGSIGWGSTFELVARFAGRDVPLTYTIVAYEPPTRVVLEARRPRFVSLDTITVEASADGGAVVRYDALLEFSGIARVLDPILQQLFNRTGAKATVGLTTTLGS